LIAAVQALDMDDVKAKIEAKELSS
jgi:hypothetical protein